MPNSLFRKKSLDKIVQDAADGVSDGHGSGLRKVLTVKDLTFMGIAAIVGAGIFSTIGVAAYDGGPGISLLFVLTAITCGFSAMCYAEFASRVPIAGSAYTYAYVSFGELVAWIIGWALILEYAIGNIVVAISWSGYFNNLLQGFNIHLPGWLITDPGTAKDAFLAATKTLAVTPGTVTFVPQVVGTSSGFTQTVTVYNTGSAVVTFSSVTVSGNFSLSNNCVGTLAPGTLVTPSSCTIGLQFTPSTSGARQGLLTITDDATSSPQKIVLNGLGITASQEISLSQTSVVFDQEVINTASPQMTVYYYNQSNVTVNFTSVVLTGADFTMANGCVTSISPNSVCNIKITFKPTAAGIRTGTIVITDSAPGSPRTITLSGTGVAAAAPGVNLTPTSLTFASQALGSTSLAQNINLTNSGEANLSITGITVTGANPGDYAQTNNCPATLIPDFSCNIAVTFKPLATGTRTASISIADNVSPSPQTVTLTGTGAPGTTPLVTFTPPSLTFSNVPLNTASASQMSTLQNTGAAALSISSIVASGTVAGDFTETNNCPASVAVSGTCTITVTFKPSSTINQTGAVTVTDNTPNGTDALALTGNGVAPAVNLSATTLAFGSQAHGTTSAAKTVTLENSGSLALTIGAITATSNYNIVSNTCPASLGPGLTCTFGVTFSPATTGAENGFVMINDNAGDSPQFITLTGTGT